MTTSNVYGVSSGLVISILNEHAYLMNDWRSSTLSAIGLAVVSTTVYHIYEPSASVNVIEPVYYPLSIGVTFN